MDILQKTSYPVYALAQLYYPEYSVRSAYRLFRKDLYGTRGLMDALRDVGYKDYAKILSRSQVYTIVRFLGEP